MHRKSRDIAPNKQILWVQKSVPSHGGSAMRVIFIPPMRSQALRKENHIKNKENPTSIFMSMYVPSIFPYSKITWTSFPNKSPSCSAHLWKTLTHIRPIFVGTVATSNPRDLRAGRPREEAVGTYAGCWWITSFRRFVWEEKNLQVLHSFKVGAPHHPSIKMEWNNSYK